MMRRLVVAGAGLLVALLLLLIAGGAATSNQFPVQARMWNEMDALPVELEGVVKTIAQELGLPWADVAAYLGTQLNYRLPIPTRLQIARDNGGSMKRETIEQVWRVNAETWLRAHLQGLGPDLGARIPIEQRRAYDDLRQVLVAVEEARTKDPDGWGELIEHEAYTPALALLEWRYDVPVHGAFANDWGNDRPQNKGHASTRHQGTDIFAPRGTPIVSAGEGEVESAGWNLLGGWTVTVIDTPTGVRFYYAHMDAPATVDVGQRVNRGALLGRVGTSGEGDEGTQDRIAEPHLHFGMYLPGGATNPFPYLTAWTGRS